jgi:hypothetical protein
MAFDINLDTAAIRDAAAIDHCNDSVRNCPYERQNRLLGEPFAPGRAQHRWPVVGVCRPHEGIDRPFVALGHATNGSF